MIRRFGERAVVFVISAAVISLVFGAVLGQPVLFSYVTSDSMAPALDPGDGFVAVPTQVDDSLEVGDVVVFRATEVGGGGLTTHRIVGQTEEGFITRGDGNPVTDQDSGEPPVKRQQVVGKALRIGDRVVVLPALGVVPERTKTAVFQLQAFLAKTLGYQAFQGPQGLSYLFFAATLVWYLSGEIRSDDRKDKSRTTDRDTGIDNRLVVGIVVSVVVLAASAAMVVPAGPHEYTFVSADYESDKPMVIQRGDSMSLSYNLENRGVIPVILFLEPSSDDVNITPQETEISARSAVNASVTIHAPKETGQYRRYVTEYRYLAILPESLLRGLYELHPLVPIVVIDAMIGVPFYVIGVRLAGRGRLRKRSRESSESVFVRVRAWLIGLY